MSPPRGAARRPFGDNRSRPYPTTSPNTTRAGLRSPPRKYSIQSQLWLCMRRKKGSRSLQRAIECELFMLPEQYSLSGIYPDQDGVRLEAADQESADVLLRHLRASGWTVTASPIWPRYSFASPPSLSNRFTTRADRSGSHIAKPRAPTGGPAVLQEVTRQRVEKDPRRGRPGDWSGWTSTRTH